ncbi:protoporphyrinogen oxidase HemJ [Acetobacter fallax]|uniref:Protoporphyrinogen IX oxidase n=1 Tax=Acetobacter fallax TaxID=1737473 RepID=A0ABX0K8I9_9PROT|nr:protoporphyrinogen oxidase HemJ [Acetobacter fallax]NHO32722.1 protoporphyrinogen oxidase HemJ [Acetobacter fallax]NHO36218.1 protoporphyrinogen oxidase HemJ [Acetobacter fallax]
MIAVLQPWYPWLKAFHIISLIAWMAATFYLPRLFVYHCQVASGSAESERFKIMEQRLLRAIMTPAMLATLLFGVLLVLTPGVIDWSAGWWHVKLLAVACLFAFHGGCARWRSDFARDANHHTERFYRMANEVPTILMIIIVIMVVVKPF